MDKIIRIWLGFLAIAILSSCSQKETEYLFVENTLSSEKEQKNIYRISVDGERVEHIFDLGGRNLYWFSPDFRYLALVDNIATDSVPELVLTVLDVESEEIIAQIPDITPYRRQDSVLWDPTSSKILFDKTTSDRGSVDWGIYDVTNNSEELLAADTSIKLFPAWSTDSQYVAYVSMTCLDEACIRSDIIWDIIVANVNEKTTRNVTNFANNSVLSKFATGYELFCNLKWSSENQYIAFENQCLRSGPILDQHRVFTVDTTNNIIGEAIGFEQSYAYAYSYDWIEDHDLLIGYSKSDYLNLQTFLYGGVLLFDTQKTLHTRSAELLGFSGSAINLSPNGKTFIVFTAEPFFEIPQDGQLSASGATLLGEFLDGVLIISPESNKLPHGLCRTDIAYWSPDGQYVAYSSTGQQQVCNQDVMNLDVFVYSMEDKQLNNLTESFEGLSEPLGWATTK